MAPQSEQRSLQVQSGKVSGKIPMLLFHRPERHTLIHTNAAFIMKQHALTFSHAAQKSSAPNCSDMAACIFDRRRMTV